MKDLSLILTVFALAIPPMALADSEYQVGRYDFNNLSYDELIIDSNPVQTAGGPFVTYPGIQYWWDLAADPGLLSIWAHHQAWAPSFGTYRSMETRMSFDDLVFTDGSGSGGAIMVALNLDIDASAIVSGYGLPYLVVSSAPAGFWGAWYPLSHASGTQSTGVFTGLSGSDDLSGTFTGPTFTVLADSPTSVTVDVSFSGSAHGAGGTSSVITESVANFRPDQVFELPPGYTVNSVQAGIVNNTWNQAPTHVAEADHLASRTLLKSFPNPFKLTTNIQYELDRPATVRLSVYNVSGALVRSLVQTAQPAGVHSVSWDGRSDDGRALGSGVYFSRLTAGTSSKTHKILKIRTDR